MTTAGAGAVRRDARLGTAATVTAALLFAVNGAVSKVILSTGIPAERLTELRTTCSAAGLALIVGLTAPRRLVPERRELPLLLLYGVAGLALVQWLYFVAIHRLPLGIALLIQFTGPVLVALWARYAWHEDVRRRMWGAILLTLVGLGFVAEAWSGLVLDGVGVLAGLGAAAALAVTFLAGQHGVRRRDPLSLACLALLTAAIAWAVAEPWWSFPFHLLTRTTSLHGHLSAVSLPVWALCVWMVVLGSIVPFTVSLVGLRHLPVTVVGVIATLEPVAATAIGWLWLGETLDGWQLAGSAIVLGGIVLAETARRA